jgi:transcription initiation factor IIE alpha subunit
MPYVICSECRLRLYTAAVAWRRQECPRCGHPLELPSGKEQLLTKPVERVSDELARRRNPPRDRSFPRPPDG